MEEVQTYIASSVAPLYGTTPSAMQKLQEQASDTGLALVTKCCEELCEAATNMSLPQVYVSC